MPDDGVDVPILDTSQLDMERMPSHIGLILDGNGRWAKARGLHRTQGHAAGEEALFDTVNGAAEIGLGWLSAYTFSTENWTRDGDEVEFLMWFNEDLLTRRRDELHQKNVRMWFSGDLEDPRVPDRNRANMRAASELTRDNTGLNLVFCFNYGGRAEVLRAVRSLAADAVAGRIDPQSIDESALTSRFWIPEMPDPDLIVRTSGEQRISNFLLWGSAYSELLFTEKRWPDFRRQDLVDAIVEYQNRNRRFGSA